MNAATNFGVFMMGTYALLHEYKIIIPYTYSVPILLMTSAFGSYFAAAFYSVTINNSSIMLYMACAMGGSVGALSTVIFTPFLTAYESNMIR